MFNILSASIGIIGSQGIEDLSEGNIMGDELFGGHQHLVLLYQATETVALNTPWCGQYPGSDQRVLDGSQFHVVFTFTSNHVLIDLTQSRANWTQDGFGHENLWKSFLCRL